MWFSTKIIYKYLSHCLCFVPPLFPFLTILLLFPEDSFLSFFPLNRVVPKCGHKLLEVITHRNKTKVFFKKGMFKIEPFWTKITEMLSIIVTDDVISRQIMMLNLANHKVVRNTHVWAKLDWKKKKMLYIRVFCACHLCNVSFLIMGF